MDAKKYKPATPRVHPHHPSSRTQKRISRPVEQSLVNARHNERPSADAKEPTRLGFTNKGSATTRWTPRMASPFCGWIVSSVLIAATTYIKQDTEKDFSIQTSSACTWTEMLGKHLMDEPTYPSSSPLGFVPSAPPDDREPGRPCWRRGRSSA